MKFFDYEEYITVEKFTGKSNFSIIVQPYKLHLTNDSTYMVHNPGPHFKFP